MNKFGIREFEKLSEEVKIGKSDVKTVQIVLTIVGVPNTVVVEAENLISAYDASVEAYKGRIEEEESVLVTLKQGMAIGVGETARIRKMLRLFN